MSVMKFKGLPATVVIELESKHGVIRVPVHDLTSYTEKSSQYGELRIAIGRPLMERLYVAESQMKKVLGP